MPDIMTPIDSKITEIRRLDTYYENGALRSDVIRELHTLRYRMLCDVAGYFLGEMERSRRLAGIELPKPGPRALQSLTNPEAIIWRSQQ